MTYMKRTGILVALFCMLLTVVAFADSSYLYEGFDGEASAIVWKHKGFAEKDSHTIEVSPGDSDNAFKFYKDLSSVTTKYVSSTGNFGAYSGDAIVDFNLRVARESAAGFCSIDIMDADEKSLVSLNLGYNKSYPDAAFAIKTGSGRGVIHTASPVTADRWYHIKMLFNTDKDMVTIFVDDFEKAVIADAPVLTAGNNISKIIINSNNQGWAGNIYLDDFKVYKNTPEAACALTYETLDLGDLSSVSDNIKLPTIGENDVIITWTSSNPDVIDTNGNVTRPDSDTVVQLTAKISSGSVVLNKTFTATVAGAVEPTELSVEAITFVNEEGTVINAPLWDADSYINVKFSKPRNFKDEVNVFYAHYDKNGFLKGVSGKTHTLNEGKTKDEKRITVDGYELSSGGKLKTFVWCDNSVIPVCETKNVVLGTRYEKFTTNTYFSDNAVLQRGEKVLVIGNGPEGKEISVTFDGVTKSAVVENDVWKVYFDAHEADGKNYTMTVSGEGYKKEFKNIVFGDVYLLSGQSNMAYTMGKFMNAADYSEETVQKYTEDLKAADNYPNLRTYKMRTTGDLYSDRPVEEPMRNWNVISSTNASAFSAIGFYFGIDLAENTDVPIGMILSAISGSYLQAWLDDETIENENVDTKGKDSFYNSLIHPFTKFPINAVLWYQGESNYNDAGNYARYLKVLISSWRENFNNPTLPFLYVQLPSYGPWDYRGIRDAQMEVYKSVDNVAMAVLTDEGEENQIHPADKETVGKRLSLLARGMFYGYDKEYRSPIVKAVVYNGGSATVLFDYVADGLKTPDNEPVAGFEACSADGVYVDATAVISGNGEVTVTAEGISEIKGVRYSYKKMMDGNLYNSENLPAAPFGSK